MWLSKRLHAVGGDLPQCSSFFGPGMPDDDLASCEIPQCEDSPRLELPLSAVVSPVSSAEPLAAVTRPNRLRCIVE